MNREEKRKWRWLYLLLFSLCLLILFFPKVLQVHSISHATTTPKSGAIRSGGSYKLSSEAHKLLWHDFHLFMPQNQCTTYVFFMLTTMSDILILCPCSSFSLSLSSSSCRLPSRTCCSIFICSSYMAFCLLLFLQSQMISFFNVLAHYYLVGFFRFFLFFSVFFLSFQLVLCPDSHVNHLHLGIA